MRFFDRNMVLSTLIVVVHIEGSGCQKEGAATIDGGSTSTAGTAPDGQGGRAQPSDAADSPGAGGTGARNWATWPMPNPVSTGLPNPQTYDITLPGIVLDKVTGLMWERAVNARSLLWPDANAYCKELSLAGHDDWRLPALIELVSIVDFTRANPAIDSTAFPDTPIDSFWTSSPMVGSPGEFWYIGFSTGFDYHGHPDFLAIKVRCVR